MRFLCVSDIQGNLQALAAVLATAERTGYHKLLVAGDLLFPGPEPLETWRRLTAANAICVQGATDRALATFDPKDLNATTPHELQMLERFATVREEVGELVLERLRRLPTEERFPLEDGSELVLVHGSPHDPFEAMSHDLEDDEILALMGTDPADVVVCGMSHVPFERTVDTLRIINVGSVGDAPDGRAPGEPPKFAHATWIESSPAGLLVEPFVVPLT